MIATVFLIGELIEWSLFKHSGRNWYLRFGTVSGYPNLKPIISTLKVALGIFVIVIFISPFILTPLVDLYIQNIISQSKESFLLLILSLSFSLLWIWHHVVGKDWNVSQYVLLAVVILSFIGYAYANLASPSFGFPSSQYLTISGKISGLGRGENITKIIFVDHGYPISANLNGESYFISLPNQNATYNISAHWQGQYQWQGGIAYTKLFSVTENAAIEDIIYNLTFAIPHLS